MRLATWSIGLLVGVAGCGCVIDPFFGGDSCFCLITPVLQNVTIELRRADSPCRIEGARIELWDGDSPLVMEEGADCRGYYSVTPPRAGVYSITIEAAGFAAQTIENVRVDEDDEFGLLGQFLTVELDPL